MDNDNLFYWFVFNGICEGSFEKCKILIFVKWKLKFIFIFLILRLIVIYEIYL